MLIYQRGNYLIWGFPEMGGFQHQNWGYSSSMCIDVDGDIIVIELDGVFLDNNLCL